MDSRTVFVFGFAIALALTLFGCSRTLPEDNAYKAKLGEEFRLKSGELAVIESEGLVVRFLNVTGDSRCPKDVQCFWAGQVTVLVNAKKNGVELGNFELTLRSGEPKLAEKKIGSYTIKLLSADLPYGKPSGRAEEVNDYLARFVVNKD